MIESLSFQPLYQMNPQSRFSDRAADYARYRPSYPAEAINTILEGLEFPLIAADIGAGTGISSRLLGDRGLSVLAIEPNQEMRQAATPHLQVDYRHGTAESTGLAEASVNLVTCFQSFHWFEPVQTLKEFSRILKSKGRLAVVWNERDRGDDFTSRYTLAIEQASHHHPAESRLGAVDPLLASPLFSTVRHFTFSYQQALNLESLLGAPKCFLCAKSRNSASAAHLRIRESIPPLLQARRFRLLKLRYKCLPCTGS